MLSLFYQPRTYVFTNQPILKLILIGEALRPRSGLGQSGAPIAGISQSTCILTISTFMFSKIAKQ